MSENLKLYKAIRAQSDQRWKVWETFTAGEEIHVADVASYDEKTDKLSVVRLLLTAHRHIMISRNLLEPPVSSENLADTSKWNIQKTVFMKNCFVPAMITGMFYGGAIEPDYKASGKVLLVGIGAGGIMNFIYSAFPNIDLTGVEISKEILDRATGWFQLESSERQRLHVEDGIDFIAREVEKGVKYDVILIDAAYNGFLDAHDDPFLAPVPVFREKSFFQSAKKALTEKGAIIFNVIAADGLEPTFKRAEEFKGKLQEVFCDTFEVDTIHNRIVGACMSPSPDAGEIKKKIDALQFTFQDDPTADIEEIY